MILGVENKQFYEKIPDLTLCIENKEFLWENSWFGFRFKRMNEISDKISDLILVGCWKRQRKGFGFSC